MTFTGSGEERQLDREAFRKFPELFLKCKSRNQKGSWEGKGAAVQSLVEWKKSPTPD